MSTTTKSNVNYHLVGSYTRYSSWTARIATLLDYHRIPYTSTILNIQDPTGKALSLPLCPSGLVPVLNVSSGSPAHSQPDLTITETIAIAEFLAENHPALALWPADAHLRALARSAVAEMHAGFSEVRNVYHTNFIAQYEGSVPVSDKARKELERLLALWTQCRQVTVARLKELGREDDDEWFLFGKFGIVDSFFWPVLWRFRTYNLPLDTATPEALAWIKYMWEDERLKEIGEGYYKQAEDPVTLIPKYENLWAGNSEISYGRVAKDWKFGGSSPQQTLDFEFISSSMQNYCNKS